VGIMTGKTCVVTGGAGSIGLASAALLLEEGARVMLVGTEPEEPRRRAGGGQSQGSQGPGRRPHRRAGRSRVRRRVQRRRHSRLPPANGAPFRQDRRHLQPRRHLGCARPGDRLPGGRVRPGHGHQRARVVLAASRLPMMTTTAASSSPRASWASPPTGRRRLRHLQARPHCMAKVVAKEAAARNIRVNVFAPGPTDTTSSRASRRNLPASSARRHRVPQPPHRPRPPRQAGGVGADGALPRLQPQQLHNRRRLHGRRRHEHLRGAGPDRGLTVGDYDKYFIYEDILRR